MICFLRREYLAIGKLWFCGKEIADESVWKIFKFAALLHFFFSKSYYIVTVSAF
jgi:hypothetical protein